MTAWQYVLLCSTVSIVTSWKNTLGQDWGVFIAGVSLVHWIGWHSSRWTFATDWSTIYEIASRAESHLSIMMYRHLWLSSSTRQWYKENTNEMNQSIWLCVRMDHQCRSLELSRCCMISHPRIKKEMHLNIWTCHTWGCCHDLWISHGTEMVQQVHCPSIQYNE